MTLHISLVPTLLMTPPDANGPAGFTTQWHGHGANHQGNNEPGDTAADRHGFENAAAGKSGHKPTEGSQQDDFSEEAGLPMVQVKALPFEDDDFPGNGHDEMLDLI